VPVVGLFVSERKAPLIPPDQRPTTFYFDQLPVRNGFGCDRLLRMRKADLPVSKMFPALF
jgi:hypothetical protein